MERPGYEADKLHFNLYNRDSGETIPLTKDIDISFGGYTWDAQGKTIFADADSDGEHKVFQISMSGHVKEAIPSLQNGGLTLIPGSNSSFVFLRNSMVSPNEIWTFNYEGGLVNKPKQITFENKKSLEQFKWSQPEKIYFQGSLDAKIQGYFLKPYGFDETKTWPLVVLIHGGY